MDAGGTADGGLDGSDEGWLTGYGAFEEAGRASDPQSRNMPGGETDAAGAAEISGSSLLEADPGGAARSLSALSDLAVSDLALSGQAGPIPTSADAPAAESPAPAESDAPPLKRPTVHGEFVRVVRARPDWLFGMLSSWGLGYGIFLFIVLFTHPDLTHDPKPTVVYVVLSAIADGSLTNQLAAEPEWAANLLRAGEDPARILRVRNLMLFFCELFFVCTVVALVAWRGHSDAWIPRALPELFVLPLVPIAIGNLTSVLVPTPFMRLRCRFQCPGTWIRWVLYVTIPFVLSTISIALYWVPSQVEAHYQSKVLERIGSLKHVTVTLASATHIYVTIWLVLFPLWQLLTWLISLRIADSLARMRRHGLARLMDRHTELAGSLPPITLYQATKELPGRFREIPSDISAELKLISSELLEASTTLTRL